MNFHIHKNLLMPFIAMGIYNNGLAQSELKNPEPASPAFADTENRVQGASQDIVIEHIGGRPIARATIKYNDLEINGKLIFDVSLTVPLKVHEASINFFELNAMSARGEKFDLTFKNGVKLYNVPVEGERYPLLVEHTRTFAPELNEIPVIGFFGPSAFSSNVVQLDQSKGLLRSMGVASDLARKLEQPYSRTSCGLVVSGKGPAGIPLNVNLSNVIHDTTLSPSILKQARKKGVAPNVLTAFKMLNESESGKIPVQWGKRNAVRFTEMDETWPKSVNAIIGSEALSKAIITIWPKRKKISIQPSSISTASKNAQDYFYALADKDADAVNKFIATKPNRRLMDDACLELIDFLLIDPKTTLPQVKQALDNVGNFYRPERRSEQLLNITDKLEEERKDLKELDAIVDHALSLSIRESSKALEATAVHDVYLRLGRRALTAGKLKQARRYLLSSAFGMPHSGESNYWLGEYYLKMGKLRRAWSRYFQVLLDTDLQGDDKILLDSISRVKQLNMNSDFRKVFNMPEAEEYMSGRLEDSEFHAQTRYRFIKKMHPHKVHMVELFINPKTRLGGGMELAFQALSEFYDGNIVLAAYHTHGPLATKAGLKRLAYYKKRSAPLIVVDGKPMFDKAFGDGLSINEDASIHYPQIRKATLPDKAPETSDWEITGSLEKDSTNINIKISAKNGTTTDDLKFSVLLCEKSVMETQGNGVYFHQYVVRDQLTPAEGIDLSKITAQPFEANVNIEKLRQKFSYPKSKKLKSFIDPNQLFAVGIIQRGKDSRILSATQIDFPK